MATSIAKSHYDAAHPSALAMDCSNGRFTEAVDEFLCGLGFPRFDTLTIPGGPALLEMLSADSGAVMVIRKSFSFLVTGHHIRHVVLVAHQGCGYDKAHLTRDRSDALVARQYADLKTAENWGRAHHGDTDVQTFYARFEGAHVVFEECSCACRRN